MFFKSGQLVNHLPCKLLQQWVALDISEKDVRNGKKSLLGTQKTSIFLPLLFILMIISFFRIVNRIVVINSVPWPPTFSYHCPQLYGRDWSSEWPSSPAHFVVGFIQQQMEFPRHVNLILGCACSAHVANYSGVWCLSRKEVSLSHWVNMLSINFAKVIKSGLSHVLTACIRTGPYFNYFLLSRNKRFLSCFSDTLSAVMHSDS